MPEPVRFVAVARVADVPPGAVRQVRAGDRWYALANVGGTIYALDNACPHNGGPLGKGTLDGAVLTCPWHGWQWDVPSGRAVSPPSPWRARRVPVRVEDGVIELPEL